MGSERFRVKGLRVRVSTFGVFEGYEEESRVEGVGFSGLQCSM